MMVVVSLIAVLVAMTVMIVLASIAVGVVISAGFSDTRQRAAVKPEKFARSKAAAKNGIVREGALDEKGFGESNTLGTLVQYK